MQNKYVLFLISFILLSVISAEVKIVTLDNKIHFGNIIHLDTKSITIESSGKKATISSLKIVEIHCSNQEVQATKSSIVLSDGSQIFGNIVSGNRNFITLESRAFGNISIELTKIKEIQFAKNLKPLRSKNQEEDVLYFNDGDVMKCIIESFGKGYVKIQHDELGTRKEYFNKLKRISFVQIEEESEKKNFFKAVVIGVDGSILHGKIVSFSRGMITMKLTKLEKELQLSFSNIKHIFFSGGSFLYLSDLSKTKVNIRYIPFFPCDPKPFECKFDLNQRGNPIRLGEQSYYKGIGVISRTEIEVNLDAQYKRFQSHIGIDTEIEELFQQNSTLMGGSVIFQIFLDGKKHYDSGLITWNSKPLQVDIDIREKKKMLLIVDFGENAFGNDIANWAGARLLK